MRHNTDLKGIWNSIDGSIPEFSGDSNFWERLKEKVDFASSKPEKIPGIVESKLESDREGEYYILKSPRAGTYLKLTDRDFYLWSLMDGTRSVKDLVIEYFTMYNSFAFARVVSLVSQLKSNFFLIDRPVDTFDNLRRRLDRGKFGHRADRLWKSFLNREFSLHGIDRYIGKAYKAFGWIFFTKPMSSI